MIDSGDVQRKFCIANPILGVIFVCMMSSFHACRTCREAAESRKKLQEARKFLALQNEVRVCGREEGGEC